MQPLTFERNELVLFSGGQDSITCLIWALQYFNKVETMGFEKCRDSLAV